MELLAVQTGETIWQEQARLENLAGVPLSEKGRQVIRRIGMELVPHEPTMIFAPAEQTEQETADLLAEELSLKVRTVEGLAELDFGLWQGLTLAEVRRRQPKLHKQWHEAPSSVRPPGGETLDEAYARIERALATVVRQAKKQVPVVVLRPVAMGLLRCRLSHIDLDRIWEGMNDGSGWVRYDIDPKTV